MSGSHSVCECVYLEEVLHDYVCVCGGRLKYMSLNNSQVERKLPGSCFSHNDIKHTNHHQHKTDLNSSMGTEIEVKLVRVSDAYVHSSPSRDVPTTTNLDKERKEHIHFPRQSTK